MKNKHQLNDNALICCNFSHLCHFVIKKQTKVVSLVKTLKENLKNLGTETGHFRVHRNTDTTQSQNMQDIIAEFVH